MLGKEVDLAEIITSTNLIVNGRTENGLYPRRNSGMRKVFTEGKVLSSFF